jgi:hypothetical protein
LAQRLDLFQLLPPQLVNIFVECQRESFNREVRLIGAKDDEMLKRDYKQPATEGVIPSGELGLPVACTRIAWYIGTHDR